MPVDKNSDIYKYLFSAVMVVLNIFGLFILNLIWSNLKELFNRINKTDEIVNKREGVCDERHKKK